MDASQPRANEGHGLRGFALRVLELMKLLPGAWDTLQARLQSSELGAVVAVALGLVFGPLGLVFAAPLSVLLVVVIANSMCAKRSAQR